MILHLERISSCLMILCVSLSVSVCKWLVCGQSTYQSVIIVLWVEAGLLPSLDVHIQKDNKHDSCGVMGVHLMLGPCDDVHCTSRKRARWRTGHLARGDTLDWMTKKAVVIWVYHVSKCACVQLPTTLWLTYCFMSLTYHLRFTSHTFSSIL